MGSKGAVALEIPFLFCNFNKKRGVHMKSTQTKTTKRLENTFGHDKDKIV